MIGNLGSLSFICSSDKVLTFQELSRSHETRWAKHEVIGKKPKLEWVGEGLSSVDLSIRFDSSLGVSPAKSMKKLKDMMENRLYKTLVIGGEYLGKYVIESVEEERKIHDGRGVCMIATANIKLTEFG